MSEPLRSLASITTTPSESPETRRLRRGKFCAAGGAPTASSETIAPASTVVAARIDAVDAAAEDGDRAAAAGERAAVGGRVDAEREAAHHRHPGGAELARDALGGLEAVRARRPRADDGDRLDVRADERAADVEQGRRIVDEPQPHGIALVGEAEDLRAAAQRAVDRGVDVLPARERGDGASGPARDAEPAKLVDRQPKRPGGIAERLEETAARGPADAVDRRERRPRPRVRMEIHRGSRAPPRRRVSSESSGAAASGQRKSAPPMKPARPLRLPPRSLAPDWSRVGYE
jgi:hypothetical protein